MAQIMRVSIKGQLPSGEEWSVNPVWSIGGDFGVPVSAAQANTIAQGISAAAVPSTLLTIWSTSTSMTAYRVEARQLNGALESQAEAVRTTPLVGTGTNNHPFQTALVASLRTPLAGASGRGRLYWPATAALLDVGTLRLNSTTQANALAATKTYLSAIENVIKATLTGVALGVWSRKGSGDINLVNSIQVGNVLDVQRRRRDSLVENYLAATYPT